MKGPHIPSRGGLLQEPNVDDSSGPCRLSSSSRPARPSAGAGAGCRTLAWQSPARVTISAKPKMTWILYTDRSRARTRTICSDDKEFYVKLDNMALLSIILMVVDINPA